MQEEPRNSEKEPVIRKALKDEERGERFRRIKAEKDYGLACQALILKLERVLEGGKKT
jgi:hypothetical protein